MGCREGEGERTSIPKFNVRVRGSELVTLHLEVEEPGVGRSLDVRHLLLHLGLGTSTTVGFGDARLRGQQRFALTVTVRIITQVGLVIAAAEEVVGVLSAGVDRGGYDKNLESAHSSCFYYCYFMLNG